MSAMLRAVDHAIAGFSRRRSASILRVAIGLLFTWFGLLKLLGHSPVEGMVLNSVPWLSGDYVMPVIGVAEVIVGLGLLTTLWLPLAIMLLWLQAIAYLLALVFESHFAFQPGNPLVPTSLGDFILRNLVLLAAGLVAATARR